MLKKTYRSFRKGSAYQRAQLFSNLAASLRKNQDRIATVITSEMGKIPADAKAEIEKCATEAIGTLSMDRRCLRMHPQLRAAPKHTCPVVAALSPHAGWKEPVLRLVDTVIGVGVGVVGVWVTPNAI